MNAPLGRAVGNANEVKESLDILAGNDKGLEDIRDLSIEFAARMVADYRGQMAAYRRAVTALTGIPPEGVSSVLLLTATGAAVPVG